ncbi:MAG: CDP-alcohol phosphatidyltransferase family protein [Egibacteraceae bacterium]
MTTAIVVATATTAAGGPAALLRFRKGSVLGRLTDQLVRHGVDRIHVLTRSEWEESISHEAGEAKVEPVQDLPGVFRSIGEIAGAGGEGLLLLHGEILMHDSVLVGLLRDPRIASGIVSTTAGSFRRQAPAARLTRGRVVAAESPYHSVVSPTAAFLGLTKIDPADCPVLAEVCLELAELCSDPLPPKWEGELAVKVMGWGNTYSRRWAAQQVLAEQLEQGARAAWLPDPGQLRAQLRTRFEIEVLNRAEVARQDAVSLVLTGLVRRGLSLTSVYLRDLFWARPLEQEEASAADAAMAVIDEERVLLASAVKASDGFFTTFFVSPYSRYVARWAARRGLSPNQVTTASMLLGILAATAFSLGTRAGMIAGAILLQVAFTTDCVDGQLARYTRQFSKLGAWLDSVFDRGKEYVVYVGLSAGAMRVGDDGSIWLLAIAALSLQVFRHTLDFSYGAKMHGAISEAPPVSLMQPDERPDVGGHQQWRATLSGGVLDESADDDADEGDVDAEAMDDHAAEAEAAAGDEFAGRPRRAADDGNPYLQALGRTGIRLSVMLERRRWMKWIKRIVVLPIGERFALISVTAAVGGPRVTFVALLGWGAFAALYTMTGRVLRSWI